VKRLTQDRSDFYVIIFLGGGVEPVEPPRNYSPERLTFWATLYDMLNTKYDID